MYIKPLIRPDTAIYCDQCHKDTDTIVKKEWHSRGIQEYYFKCMHCKYKYTISVTNKRARTLQKKMQKLNMRYSNDNKTKTQQELDTIMTRLKHNLVTYGVADL